MKNEHESLGSQEGRSPPIGGQAKPKSDRFTGGAYHGALFQEQPIFSSKDTCLKLELELRNPKEYEIGLLLLLLKDLWTGDLPVGGESSIGRGRLKGKEATIKGKTLKCKLEDKKGCIEITPHTDLEKYVSELVNYIENNNEPNHFKSIFSSNIGDRDCLDNIE
jgi:hypothetical protein